ncbi:hypothetical protein [Williamsia serinedens]|uniref:Uncharacterized protein n=1 Tax=Williamsia serinedens TaxID=391736 RepID=A0ABT1H203_9NOCA|nr:hypothetical protein [Williamsia serinedens]MCP2161252.1 hypothetical protein [Williamsia serinedens]
MGDVVPLFRRMPSSAVVEAVTSIGAEGAVHSAPDRRLPSNADRAQAALFAELLVEHRARITLALDEVQTADLDQARLDRAALRRELREVAVHLEKIGRLST